MQDNHYRSGGTYGICDECGLKFRLALLRRRYDGFMVCRKDWEPQHPQEKIYPKSDRVSVPNARPDGDTPLAAPVTPEDL
jgi:hypothetical protein